MKLGKEPKRVAEYFLWRAQQEGRALTPMQVLKLVYIAHGWLLGLNARPLVNEEIEAWQYGPVIPSLYHAYKQCGAGFIRDFSGSGDEGFEYLELAIMDQVWNGYGHRSGISLSTLTHEPGTPWSLTVKDSGLGAVISNDLIEDYYRRKATQNA
jgi:uncharacterized phage-associated protein